MAEGRCFSLRVGDYQNCLCPDRSSCRKCADNRVPPKKASLSLNHRPKGEEKCVSRSSNKENGSGSWLRRNLWSCKRATNQSTPQNVRDRHWKQLWSMEGSSSKSLERKVPSYSSSPWYGLGGDSYVHHPWPPATAIMFTVTYVIVMITLAHNWGMITITVQCSIRRHGI